MLAPFPSFWSVGKLSKNFNLVGEFLYKDAKLGAENLLLGKTEAKLKF